MGNRIGCVLIVGVVFGAACIQRKDGVTPTNAAPGDACAEPGAVASCYTGPIGTLGVGTCAGGVTTCTWDLTWSACDAQTLPVEDDCTNVIDDDCDGKVDEGADADGDGWGVCNGDCCDDTGCASDPKRVNPGAFEAAGNTLDDDCDGMIDNVDPPCVAEDPMTNGDITYAQSLDLCRTTAAEATGIDQRWGVISSKITRADGMPLEERDQVAIRTSFGVNTPRFGDTFLLLATGPATDPRDPLWQPWQAGTTMQGPAGNVPADWLFANQGKLPSAPGCVAPGGTIVNDPVMLTLEIRVPTNASSFSISSFFFSSEYPEFVCTNFNDFFIVLLKSEYTGEPRNPRDGNLAFYTDPDGKTFPVGVNLAKGTDLFRQCVNGPMGCSGAPEVTDAMGCVSTADLVGTGFDEPDTACGTANSTAGGGTGWLTTTGNVVPGEIITVRIAIWDTSDSSFDSAALIDSFRWNIEPSTPGTGMVPQ